MTKEMKKGYIYIYIYIYIHHDCYIVIDNNHPLRGGAGGVMVIVEGNGHGDSSSNPGRE